MTTMFTRRVFQKCLSCIQLKRPLGYGIHTKSPWLAPRGNNHRQSNWSVGSLQSECNAPSSTFPRYGVVSSADTDVSPREDRHSRGQSLLVPVGLTPAPPTVSISSPPEGKLTPEGSDEAKKLYDAVMGMEAEELLQFVSSEHKSLDKVHFALAMKRLFYLHKHHSRSQAFTEHLQKHPGFEVLCALVALKAQHYDVDVATDMFRFMAIMGLNSDHPAIQVYLQLMKYHVNDLDLDALIRVAYSLTMMVESPQTKILIEAIRTLIPSRKNLIPSLNGWQLATLLEIFGATVGEDVVEETMHHLLENDDMIGYKLAIILLRALRTIPNPNNVLIDFCIDKVLDKMNILGIQDVKSVLESCNEMQLYDLELFKEMGTKFLGDDIRLSDKNDILALFRHQSFIHKELVADFKTCLSKEILIEPSFHSTSLLQIIKTLSESTTSTELWLEHSNVQHKMISEDLCNTLSKGVENGWSSYTLGEKAAALSGLAVLGCSPSHLVSELLNCNELTHLTEATNAEDHPSHGQIASIIFRATLAAIIARCDIPTSFDHVLMSQRSGNVALKRMLEVAMGDAKYVLHGPCVQRGHIIDHLLLMAPGGALPVEDYIQNGGRSLMLSNLPGDVKTVAVMSLHGNCFHRNTGQLKGLWLLHARLLQKEGFHVAVIDNKRWWRMGERGRIPYLERLVHNTLLYQDLWVP